MQKTNFRNIGLLLSITVALLFSVSAFGISSPYWDTNPMTPHAGSTQTIQLRLQNMVGDKDVTARVKLMNGSEIASIIDSSTDYSVPLGKDNVPINLKVSIPTDAKDGERYNIKLSITTLAISNSGALGVGSSIEKSFDVIITSDKKQSLWQNITSGKSTTLYYVIGAIAVVGIGLFLVFRAKKNKSSYRR